MNSSLLNRLILLAFLPVIGVVLYLEGQKYDPALIRFMSPEAGEESALNLLPREISGFQRVGAVRIFTKENLYEYINGHAEYFLTAGFEKLVVGDYVQSGTDPDQSDVIVDIYDMGRSIQAVGVLTEETGKNPGKVLDEIVGAKTPQGISFVSGNYYIKIASYRSDVPVETFAGTIHRMIGESSETPAVSSLLPDLGDVVATRFVKEAYRGLGFVKDVIEREYRINGKTVQVSAAEGSREEIQRLLAAYLNFFREDGIEYTEQRKGSQSLYKVIDPYEGDWYLIPRSDSLYGIYGAADEETVDRFIASLSKAESRSGMR